MTDAAEILSPSPTGVPARLRIAGVGARAYAFTVDFNIRIAIAFAWYSTGAVLHSSVNAAEVSLRRPREPDLWWTYAIEIPVVVMFILYHPIVETLLRGISPGKRFVGLRIATLAGGVPNPGPLLLRNLFRLIDSAPIFYGVGLLMTMFNRNGQRLGDLAAGTLLVYDNGRSEMKVEAGSGFDAAAALIAEHRSAARQLALARRDAPGAAATEMLENRHAALHHGLARETPTLPEMMRKYAEETLPAATHELRPFLAVTLLGFLLAVLAGWGLVTIEPESIRLFASPEILQKVQQGELWTDGLLGVAPSSVISGAIFFNNAVVALVAWLLGFLFALGTIYAIGVNGMMFGALSALCVANGLGYPLQGSGRPGCRAARRQPRSNGSRSAKADRSDALCTGSSCADARGTAHPSSHHSDHSTPIDRRHERAGVSNDTLMQAATRPSPSPRNEAVPPFARDRGTARHPGR